MRVHRTPPRTNRVGTTLTEVLMALLVTGIGLTSVMYLFPLSLQRAIQANQNTNATLLRINAEARLEASVWTDGTGRAIQRAIVEDPDKNGNVLEHEATKFVFDPLGTVIMSGDGTATAIATNATAFGDFDGNKIVDIDDFNYDVNSDGNPDFEIARYTFGYNTVDEAEAFVTLPDSFITLADVFGSAVSVSGATPPVLTINGPDLTEYIGQTGVRVTFISSALPPSSVLFTAATVTGAQTIELGAGTAIPTGFEIGRVTVELPERRYTWLATVRRFGTQPSVTVVVFFRRSFAVEDEQVWPVNEPPGGYNEFEIPVAAGVDPPPGLRVGGWMFDMHAFRWMKVASIQPIDGGFRFTTDPEEQDLSPAPRDGIPVIFPRGVVEAYPLVK